MELTWCRNQSGYEWQVVDGKKQLIQSATLNEAVGVRRVSFGWERYRPGEESPPLFRQFAGLVREDDSLDADAALVFARRFGHLSLHARLEEWRLAQFDQEAAGGAPRDAYTQRNMIGVKIMQQPPRAEPIAQGVTEFVVLFRTSDAVEVAMKEPDWKGLCGLPPQADEYRPAIDGGTNQGVDIGETITLWERNAKTMRKLVTQYDAMGESKDADRDRAILETYFGQELDGRVMVCFVRCGQTGAGVPTGPLDLRPRDLIGFIWLQFARQVSGAEEYRRCPACGEFFSLLRHGLTANQRNAPRRIRKKYSTAVYCSELCQKDQHYRTVTVPARKKVRPRAARHKKGAKPTLRPGTTGDGKP